MPRNPGTMIRRSWRRCQRPRAPLGPWGHASEINPSCDTGAFDSTSAALRDAGAQARATGDASRPR
eukprot:2311418-Pyramimonas_sp.AAC.1